MLAVVCCSGPPAPTPRSDETVPVPTPVGQQTPAGIPAEEAIALARQHVDTTAGLVAAEQGRLRDFSTTIPAELAGGLAVWAIRFTSLIEICPPQPHDCFTPRPGYTTVFVDYQTGDFLWSETFSPRR